jgi:leucyl aminopeptidase
MNFSVKTGNPTTLATPVLVLGLFDDGTLPPLSAVTNKATRSVLSRVIKAGDIKGKLGESLLLQKTEGCRAQRILLIGLGKQQEIDTKKYATALRATVKALQQYQLANALVTLPALDIKDIGAERKASLLARLFVTAQYRYNTTKPKAGKPFQLEQITLLLDESKDRTPAQRGLATGTATGRGMNVARELGNLPANICTPTYLGKQALQLTFRQLRRSRLRARSTLRCRRLRLSLLPLRRSRPSRARLRLPITRLPRLRRRLASMLHRLLSRPTLQLR